MKTYYECSNLKSIFIDGKHIPKDKNNRDYAIFLYELEKGEAELVPFVAPTPTWEKIKTTRQLLLKESDWTGTVDAQPKPSKQAWLNYRQALRDIPQNFQNPEDVVWPVKPE